MHELGHHPTFNELAEGWAGDPTTRPAWMGDPGLWRTPQEDWDMFATNMSPFWSVRAPMAETRRNLEAQYSLGVPYMIEAGAKPTFQQFLSDYIPSSLGRGAGAPEYSPYGLGYRQRARTGGSFGYDELRRRSAEAAQAATSPMDPYLEQAAIQYGTDSPEYLRRAWLAGQFSPESDDPTQALKHQLSIAQMLATQRPGGRSFGGRVGQALRNATARLFSRRKAAGQPSENFLSWYLSKMSGGMPEGYGPVSGLQATATGSGGTGTNTVVNNRLPVVNLAEQRVENMLPNATQEQIQQQVDEQVASVTGKTVQEIKANRQVLQDWMLV